MPYYIFLFFGILQAWDIIKCVFQYHAISEKILKKCGGLLFWQWEKIQKSLKIIKLRRDLSIIQPTGFEYGDEENFITRMDEQHIIKGDHEFLDFHRLHLPKQIRGLENLQTLDIRDAIIQGIPSDPYFAAEDPKCDIFFDDNAYP
ncbi:hypothetical protein ACJX0J_021786, partial [Zea mays]